MNTCAVGGKLKHIRFDMRTLNFMGTETIMLYNHVSRV